MKIEDTLERFALCHEAEEENRRLALDDLRFALLSEQWDERIAKSRKNQGRPMLTINRVPAFCRQVINDARQNRPSVRVRPVDSTADVKTARILDGLIRNIEQQSNASVAYDTAIEFSVYGGFGYWRVKTDYAHDDAFDLDICIDRIPNVFTVYADPHSQAPDATDWNLAFVTSMLTHKEFKRRYPGAELVDFEGRLSDTQRLWVNEDTVQIAEEWRREEVNTKIVRLSNGAIVSAEQFEQNRNLFDPAGIVVTGERDTKRHKVTQRIVSGAEELEAETDFPCKYIPIVPVYGEELNIEGRRYFKSLHRDAKDAQRNLNYWRSAATELVALAPKAPFIGPVGAFTTDQARWETANVENHPYLEYDGQFAPQRQPFAGVPAGAIQEALNASDDMKSIMGMYDASLGARSNETSGRAIMARQREGDVSTFHFIDNLNRAIQFTGRILVDMIPRVYTGERVMRVLGEDGKPDMVSVNNGMIDLTRGKYDVVSQPGPSYTSKREEFVNTMIELQRSNPAAGQLVMDKVVQHMDFPESEIVAARYKAMLPPQIQALEGNGDPAQALMQTRAQMQQMGQQIQQMQVALQQAQQSAQSKQAESQAKVAQAKIEADTDRWIAEQKAQVEKELAVFEMQLKAQTEVEIERIRAGVQMQSQMQAAQTIAPVLPGG